MINDDVIWNVLKNSFCSYKVKERGLSTMCKHRYNLNGKCSGNVCPLANSQYATVLDHKGKIYLNIKTIERAHQPARLWQRIELSANLQKAYAQIEKELEWWPEKFLKGCKARLLRYREIHRTMRRMRLRQHTELETINKKDERRLLARERKARKAAQVEMHLQKELLSRLQKGAYDSTVKITDEELEALCLADMEQQKQLEVEEEEGEAVAEKELGQFGSRVAAWSSDEESDDDDDERSDSESDAEEPPRKRPNLGISSKAKKGPGGKKKVEIIHEIEQETESAPKHTVASLLDF